MSYDCKKSEFCLFKSKMSLHGIPLATFVGRTCRQLHFSCVSGRIKPCHRLVNLLKFPVVFPRSDVRCIHAGLPKTMSRTCLQAQTPRNMYITLRSTSRTNYMFGNVRWSSTSTLGLILRDRYCSGSVAPSVTQLLSVKPGLNHSCYFIRLKSSQQSKSSKKSHVSAILYISAVLIGMLGMSYAGVPLYRMFCQATGLGGMAVKGHDQSKVETMKPVEKRIITVKFNADTASSMQWNFQPQQSEVRVMPGETALAFYTARNPTDKPIIGISTYNVIPFDAGQYFNKIQCFCFEEQRLNPREQVDMPVFFFIDPEYAEDPKLEDVDTICLSYTFFEAKEGLKLPLPGYMQAM